MSIESLRARIDSREATVAIMGMGYVGLPLAVAFAEDGYPTIGLDVDAEKVATLQAGRSHVGDVDSESVNRLVKSERLRVSGNFDLLAGADVIIMCVPTPLSKSGDPDISYIIAATLEVQQRLRPGQLVILESTTYPGTTEEVVLPRLASETMHLDREFLLAFSPERIDPGNPIYNVRNTAKVVGGVTETSTELAAALYGSVLERVVPVQSATTAEMVKILENTFRAVNIGLVNEVAMMCDRMHIDVWEVIDAAATKPFGFLPFYPGPGLGGHCIPIDPFYLSWKMRTLDSRARFIELAGDVNSGMPGFVVQKVVDGLNHERKAVRGSRILLMGVAYKANVSDVRESPAFDIATELHARGAELSYHDPHVPDLETDWARLQSLELTPDSVRVQDCVVIVTHHTAAHLDVILDHASLIVDTRNATRGRKTGARVIKL